MIEDTSALRDLAERLLAHELGDDRDPARMAEATERACRKLYQQIGPVIGDTAFRAWALRALRLTRARFPFLTAELDMVDAGYLKGLRESMHGQDSAQAAEVLTALLTSFLAVFVGLMGRNLPYSFLRESWPEVEID